VGGDIYIYIYIYIYICIVKAFLAVPPSQSFSTPEENCSLWK